MQEKEGWKGEMGEGRLEMGKGKGFRVRVWSSRVGFV